MKKCTGLRQLRRALVPAASCVLPRLVRGGRACHCSGCWLDSGLVRLNIGLDRGERTLPANASEARQGYESLTENLGAGWMMPAIVLVQHASPDWITGDGMADGEAPGEAVQRAAQHFQDADRHRQHRARATPSSRAWAC